MKRTTPSEGLTHFEIGWLAGIIDGEGSLAHYYSIRNHDPSLKRSPSYGVYIVNSDMDILNDVKKIYNKIEVFGNINLKSATKKQREGSFAYTKPCYELVVRRRLDVEKLLKLVIPFLHGNKKVKARAMLDFFLLNPFNSKKQIRV